MKEDRSLGYNFFKLAKEGKMANKPKPKESPEKAKERALAVKMAREAMGNQCATHNRYYVAQDKLWLIFYQEEQDS